MTFELLTGTPPFYSYNNNRDEVYEKIKFGEVNYPKNIIGVTKNFLQCLFIKNPDKRLGSGVGEAEQIKNHPFFTGIDWNALLEKKYSAPFIPTLKSEEDLSNFDTV